jgi:hypothetical protein
MSSTARGATQLVAGALFSLAVSVPISVALADAAGITPAQAAGASHFSSPPFADAEALYADWLDALSGLSTVDSGLTRQVDGRDHEAWAERLRDVSTRLDAALASVDPAALSAEDDRALRAMRKGRTENVPDVPPPSDPKTPPIRCADAQRSSADLISLQVALYACFDEIGDRIDFQGRRIVRTTALQQLQQIKDGEVRRKLFLSFVPLWSAINAADGRDSPYRRMMALNSAETRRSGSSPVSNAAAALGIEDRQIERWLVEVLEAWRARSSGPRLEPWDYWYASADASRRLSASIPRESVLAISERFYRDLGADLEALGVRHDLEVRPGKAPLAYTDHIRIGRYVGTAWRPALPRVSANYEQGGLFILNELIHEDGHAVHEAALRIRPAYYSLGDDLFVEAFADVTAWSSSEPEWQKKYLGTSADEASSLRELFSNVMLDAAWSLFELRMMGNPGMDPNRLWTDITSRYLNIAPHAELSWWALRVQLVRWPGYMINYGLGAVLTADIRRHTREAIGDFDAGNARWYPWTSAHLLRFGASIDTPQLLHRFLGRAVSPEALLTQIRRVGSVDGLARQKLGQTAIE